MTIVFSDLKGSTAMGEKLDSEAVREVMSRYFDEMRAALERHGGTVEKYIGDAIMAVFGLPRLHEDDALRAVRAAAEMRDKLAALNEELDQRWGVTVGNPTPHMDKIARQGLVLTPAYSTPIQSVVL